MTSGGQLYFDGGLDELRAVTFTSEETVADIITALQGIDTDGDGLYDSYEQRIIDADPADAIASLANVLPEDDYDEDLFTNLWEQSLTTDPTNAADPGSATVDTDEDGLYDVYEQQIIDADPTDGFTTFADVLPGDDFDEDLYTNLEEQLQLYDPVDPTNPSVVSVDLQLLGHWDFNDFSEGATTTTDNVGGYEGALQNGIDATTGDPVNTVFTADAGGRTGEPSDYAIDFGAVTGSGRTVAVSDVNFLAAVNESTANDRLTVSFWQKNSALGGSSSYAFSSASVVRAMHSHCPWANGNIYFDHQTTTVNRDRNQFNPNVTTWDTQWNHVVMIKGRRTKQVWVNGEQKLNVQPPTDGMAEMVSLAIGSPVNSLQGQIDDFAVYNDALTPAQIALLAGGASPASIVPAAAPPKITSVIKDGDMVSLTWTSKATDTYTIYYSLDLVNWDSDIEDGIAGEASGTNTRTFDLTDFGLEAANPLFFRVER
ncbi:LamG domain-containing protein [Akkermansiaceae bacterium]|nr:LamG domain-containing protein [Akkermansiaceae bacterium]